MIHSSLNGQNQIHQHVTRGPTDHVDQSSFILPPGQMATAEDMIYFEKSWINRQQNETIHKQITSAPKSAHEILLAHRAIREAIQKERKMTESPIHKFTSTIVINENANSEGQSRHCPHRFVFNEQSYEVQQNITNPHLRRRLGIYHTSMQEMAFYAPQEQPNRYSTKRQKRKRGKFKISIRLRKSGNSKMKDLTMEGNQHRMFRKKKCKKLSKKRIKKMREDMPGRTSAHQRSKKYSRKRFRKTRIKLMCKLSALENRFEEILQKFKVIFRSLCCVLWFILGVVLFVLGLFTGAPVNYAALTFGGILMAFGLVMLALRVLRCIDSTQDRRLMNQEKRKWTFLDKRGNDISTIA